MAKASAKLAEPKNAVLTRSIEACILNGDRILGDAMWVEFQEPPCTKLMLSMIAQEEFAKSFLLFLVRERVLPWTPSLLRAMNDHACKQLVGIIIEYLHPDWETIDDLRRIIEADYKLGNRLPPNVASAINILRHEKMRRWESNNWHWLDDLEYERTARQIGDGKKDRIKQDALYVRLGRDGSVARRPTEVCTALVEAEYERAGLYRSFITTLLEDGNKNSFAYEKVIATLEALFWDKAHTAAAAPGS